MASFEVAFRNDSVEQGVFDAFNEHAGQQRIETKQRMLNIIRKWYSQHHVTVVDSASCSLLEFAAAGKATYSHEADDETFNATRQWMPVGSGVEKKTHPGRLQDEFHFARFLFEWDGKKFLLFHLIYRDPFQSPTRCFYILHARTPSGDPNVQDGHCVETDALILAAGKWTSLLHEEIWVFDNGYWEKSKELWKAVEGSSWDDVILDPDMKAGLIQDVQGFFDNQALYAQYAVPWKRGIILHGVPGNGKTVSIKALINSLYARPDQVSSLYVKSFETKCNTEQYSIRQIFQQARRCAPCLLIFEDLDSLVDDNIRSYFLNEVDGLESNDGILMIGSTNHLDKLDPAIAKRPSRFDRKYHFRLPGEKERTLYAEYWRQKLLRRNDGLEFPEELCGVVAQLTEGFSFAYLKELFVMALLSLVRGFKGDDFEIVDAAEAESAPEEEAPAAEAASGAAAEEKKEDVCECTKKCYKCGKAVVEESEAKTKAAQKKEKEKDATKKHIVPAVDIPEHLGDNLLLKVVRHQIRILVAEMDNTEPEKWKSGKKEMSASEDYAARYRAMMNRRAARG
ncbi:proteasome-activating nucleotidase [Paraphaeosphaeria sporulosa]|uniref:Proteasome-activating nucleotidase n=1 Tax=Paraphaeosphaeria sporulosa TaxID=1460663 RepID=A0A177CE68_9PLEO|nr:proteasome-activating nucleotidase [Paraphaeosphaeria sporulosa]OAG05924.1 proteasome-activating nucleotidase [Paraphaeosphaeria sporulosa]